MSLPETSEQRFGAFLPESLTDEGEPVFAEPWQAQTFSMTVSLFERGLFSRPEWTNALSAKRAARAAPGEDPESSFYYHDWLAALETLVSERVGIEPSAFADLRKRWEEVYRSTPHGEAVVLRVSRRQKTIPHI